MLKRRFKQLESFNDGVLYTTSPETNASMRYFFSYYKIGIKRFYTAQMSGQEISECVKIPMQRALTGNETVSIGNKKFLIAQIQHNDESCPPISVLTLQKR